MTSYSPDQLLPSSISACSVATTTCSASISKCRRNASRVSLRPKPSVPSATKRFGIQRAAMSFTDLSQSLLATTGPAASSAPAVTGKLTAPSTLS